MDAECARSVIAVMGTTASGKTALAEQIADKIDAQLVNADAFQVYRYLDIGTAKSERKDEYGLVNIKNPDETFGVGEWVSLAKDFIDRSTKPVVLVGGTGLYIRALLEGYDSMAPAPDPAVRAELDLLDLEALLTRLEQLDPTAINAVDTKNRVRVQRALERAMEPARLQPEPLPYKKLKFAIEWDPDIIRDRIAVRTHQMVASGWPEEVARLRDMGYCFEDPGLRAHGYRHIWNVLEGKMEMDVAVELTKSEVRRYARRQRTWLRKEPGLIWIKPDDPLGEALRRIELN